MKKLFTLLVLAMLTAGNTYAQTGITKHFPYGVFYKNYTTMPSSFYVHNGVLYFGTKFNWDMPALWQKDSSGFRVRTASGNLNLFPNFDIIGSEGDTLILLIYDRAGYPASEGIYTYNLTNNSLNQIYQNNYKIAERKPILIESDKAFYMAATSTGLAVYRHDVSTLKTDIFCAIPTDVTDAKLFHVGGTYYLSYHRVDMPNSAVYCDLYAVDEVNKRLAAQPLTPTTAVMTDLVNIGNDIYFAGSDLQHGVELYKYSGSGIPARVTDLCAGQCSGFNTYYDMAVYNNKIYFSGTDGTTLNALYEYDPATNATRYIHNTNNSLGCTPMDFYVHHCRLYFRAKDENNQHQPCVYDGVSVQQLGTFELTYTSGLYTYWKTYKDELYFSHADTFHNVHLYSFNDAHLGTPLGVTRVVRPISISAYPNPVIKDATLNIALGSQQILSVQLNDMSGRVVYSLAQKSYSTGTHSITLPMQQLPGGVYAYTLGDASGLKIYSSTLLKQ